MSRTYKLKEYVNGKPVYTRHMNREASYHWSKHELPRIRRSLNRAKRRYQKQYFRKFGEIPIVPPTNGWETY